MWIWKLVTNLQFFETIFNKDERIEYFNKIDFYIEQVYSSGPYLLKTEWTLRNEGEFEEYGFNPWKMEVEEKKNLSSLVVVRSDRDDLLPRELSSELLHLLLLICQLWDQHKFASDTVCKLESARDKSHRTLILIIESPYSNNCKQTDIYYYMTHEQLGESSFLLWECAH